MFLSGLTCTDDNFMQKSGAQRAASTLGLALVCPDTSPRGLNIEGEEDSWDFGTGAGFYVNATQPGWERYRMYDYVVEELPALLRALGPFDVDRMSVMGHSMGGHGALVVGLRNPDLFYAVSAFAPIANPMQAPWGVKAFRGYLGPEQEAWRQYDATELAREYKGRRMSVLLDTGTADENLQENLKVDALVAVDNAKILLQSRMREGYDHSYYFIATFVEEHLEFHARFLLSASSP
ncbi:putative esterase [Helicosporidium sp. ATCC 50920]|nr:putative esterase [Helicosporidium sp. ATCC 50920]|eukprot:KDD74573.1 putative esterase [Helicosporidium sp. ATCC 50920]